MSDTTMSDNAKVKTPCVGVCSTGIGDSVCRGCKRYEHEVVNWNAYTPDQRELIMQRLEGFLVRIVRNYLTVVDAERLHRQLKHQQVRFRPEQDPHCWAHELLRAGASQLGDLAHYGLQLRPEHRDMAPPELRDTIEREVYELSCAHYERYIAAPVGATE